MIDLERVAETLRPWLGDELVRRMPRGMTEVQRRLSTFTIGRDDLSQLSQSLEGLMYTSVRKETEAALPEESSSAVRAKLRDILFAGLGILRTPEGMQKTADEVRKLAEEQKPGTVDHARAMLGLAMAECALERKESRGAHYRTDYPASDENWRKTSVAALKDGAVTVRFVPAEQTGGGEGR